jgi:hypothetical protein
MSMPGTLPTRALPHDSNEPYLRHVTIDDARTTAEFTDVITQQARVRLKAGVRGVGRIRRRSAARLIRGWKAHARQPLKLRAGSTREVPEIADIPTRHHANA